MILLICINCQGYKVCRTKYLWWFPQQQRMKTR